MGARVYISPKAFIKMQALVAGFDKEVGWFGTVEKIKDGVFRVKDILVFPQYTSDCYIDDEKDDPLEFQKWLETLSDDVYGERRLWGHSHVNMGVTPSGTDTDMFERQRQANSRASVNPFTLCMIMNKKGQMFWYIDDSEEEVEYENKDIEIKFEVEECVGNDDWFGSIKSLVRDIEHKTSRDYVLGWKSSEKHKKYKLANKNYSDCWNYDDMYGGYYEYE